MSADNGIYILRTRKPPKRDGNCYLNQDGYEYRVAHCQAIDNIDYSDLYLPLYFGESKVYEDGDEAVLYAHKLSQDYDFLEYGISEIKVEKYFPNITAKAASVALDCYQGAVPLDVEPKIKFKPGKQ